jgi:hypothetical protein
MVNQPLIREGAFIFGSDLLAMLVNYPLKALNSPQDAPFTHMTLAKSIVPAKFAKVKYDLTQLHPHFKERR